MGKGRTSAALACPFSQRCCAIYVRQSRQSSSIFSSFEMQQGISTDFAHESGWRSVLRAFADNGESSETLERPALQQLLKEIETGHIDRVVVYAMDRLTRRLFDLHRVLQVFDRHDVTLHVVLDPHFGRSPEGRLMTNIVGAASEFQQDLNRERMTDARDSLKQQGRRVAGRVPYGYVVDRRSKQLIVDRVAAQCVVEILGLRRSFPVFSVRLRCKELKRFAW